MFKSPLRYLKRRISQISSECPVNPRTHFSGNWGRRELKESPIHGTKKKVSPIKLFSKASCQTASRKAVHSDKFALFYCYHFMYAEELFYGHIALLVIIARGDGRFLTKSLKANRDKSLEVTNFKFIKQLGSGSFGTVFLAEHPTRKKLVAVKKVLATDVSQGVSHAIRSLIEKEASCHCQGSPYIIQLLDTFSVARGALQAFYFVYEYADGGDLTKLIKRIHYGKDQYSCSEIFLNGRFPESLKFNRLIIPMTKYLSAQILLGVLFLHERGIIHLDLKPDNILITQLGIVKIADLGLVKRYRWFHYSARANFLTDVYKSVPNETHSDFMYIGGTMVFMEPELRGKYIGQRENFPFKFNNRITYSADYFSVGLIIFNIFTGFIYGASGAIDNSLLPKLRKLLKISYDLMLVTWYAFKRKLEDEFRKYVEGFSIDNMKSLTGGLDEGVVSILRSTIHPRHKRWTDFTIPVKVKRENKTMDEDILSISKMKKKIKLFRNLDFNGIASNGLPSTIVDFIRPEYINTKKFLHSADIQNEDHIQEDDLYTWPYFEYHLPKEDEIPKKEEVHSVAKTNIKPVQKKPKISLKSSVCERKGNVPTRLSDIEENVDNFFHINQSDSSL